MEIVVRYYLYFMIYSIIGWIMEVIVTFIGKQKLVNRGFLIGPYCPIYGWGVLAILLLVGKDTTDVMAVFLKSIFICSVLEYLTSYFMEKIFNVRWWDYSQKRFNINGRICLETMIPFGIISCLIIYLIHPQIAKIVSLLNYQSQLIIAIILFIIYFFDNILSICILFKIKGHIKYEKKDNTEKIKKYIESWLQQNSILYRRITSAFPKYQILKSKKWQNKKGKK